MQPQRDGSLRFPKQRKIPDVPDGYVRDVRDKFLMLPVFPPCELRSEEVWICSAGVKHKMVVCLESQPMTPVYCRTCPHRLEPEQTAEQEAE